MGYSSWVAKSWTWLSMHTHNKILNEIYSFVYLDGSIDYRAGIYLCNLPNLWHHEWTPSYNKAFIIPILHLYA